MDPNGARRKTINELVSVSWMLKPTSSLKVHNMIWNLLPLLFTRVVACWTCQQARKVFQSLISSGSFPFSLCSSLGLSSEISSSGTSSLPLLVGGIDKSRPSSSSLWRGTHGDRSYGTTGKAGFLSETVTQCAQWWYYYSTSSLFSEILKCSCNRRQTTYSSYSITLW